MPCRNETPLRRILSPLTAILVCCLAGTARLEAQTSKLTAEQRADALLKQMTPEEKIGQLNQAAGYVLGGDPPPEEQVRRGLAGSVLWVSEPAAINRMQKIAVEESRLHIPLLIGLDVIHGYHTIVPAPLAMSATCAPKLVERVQTIAAREARAGHLSSLPGLGSDSFVKPVLKHWAMSCRPCRDGILGTSEYR